VVIVRPQPMEANLSSFLAQLRARANMTSCQDAAAIPFNYQPGSMWPSFYMEYLALEGNVDELLVDVDLPDFASFLHEHSTNLWLGDGLTVGKLHFDPFENLLAMVSGSKRFTLYHPWHNEDLYEGHIREAELDFDSRSGSFRRVKLLNTTAMVMSPVDVAAPDYSRYPLFARAVPITCDVGPGDILYVPAFHWHEVQSSPGDRYESGALAGLNVAVNMWFKPVFDKEFPCRKCRPFLSWREYPDVVRRLLQRLEDQAEG